MPLVLGSDQFSNVSRHRTHYLATLPNEGFSTKLDWKNGAIFLLVPSQVNMSAPYTALACSIAA